MGKNTRRRRREAGLCFRCGAEPVQGQVRCPKCAAAARAASNACNTAARAQLLELLGGKCACCGSTDALQIDHILPRGDRHIGGAACTTRALVLAEPGGFQLLCRECNAWKDNGPACPCKWWDTLDAGWRERAREAMRGKGTRKD